MFNIVLQPRLLFMHNKINECTVVHNMCLTHTSSRTNKHSFIVTHDTFKELVLLPFAMWRHYFKPGNKHRGDCPQTKNWILIWHYPEYFDTRTYQMLLQVERVMITVALQNVNCTHDSQVTEEVNRCHDLPWHVELLLVLGTFDSGRGEPGPALCCSTDDIAGGSLHPFTTRDRAGPGGWLRVVLCRRILRTLRRIAVLLTN